MIISLDKTLGWDVTFNEDGSASGTLRYVDPINTATQVILMDALYNVFYIGYVTLVTKTEVGVGYEMELTDPLSGGLYSEVIFDILPSGFPAAFETKDEVDNWSAAHNRPYHYTKDGYYTFANPGALSLGDDLIAQRTIREGVNYDGYYNRIVVTGSAEKDLPAVTETVNMTVNGISVTEMFQGNRMLYRHSSGSGWSKTESWVWDEVSNICLRYESTEKSDAPAPFAPNDNEIKTVRTVPYFNEDISEYRVHQVETTREWAWEVNSAGTSYAAQLVTVARETTDIERFADGSGTKLIDNEAAARGKYYATINVLTTSEMRPVYNSDNELIDYETVALEKKDQRIDQVTIPAFGYNELVQDTREQTTYRRKGDRAYSFTNRYRPYLQVLKAPTLFDQDFGATIILLRDGGEFGNDEPELPEMEEATKTISAEVEYAEEWDTELGVYERQETLPDIPIPDEIVTDEALYNWLYQRAVDYASFKKKSSMLIDEMTIQTSLNINPEIGQTVNGFTVTSVQHSLSASTAQTTVTGTKPSAQTVPRKSQISTGALIVSAMKNFDSEHDNVRIGTVIKPVSAVRAMVTVNGKTYIIDNPNAGFVYAGDSIAVFRATGRSTPGRVI